MGAERRAGTAGFTLVELLVVTAILFVMAGLLAAAMTGAVRVAHQTACASNLRQVGLALRHYLDEHDGWFFWLVTDEPEGRAWFFGLEPLGGPREEGQRILDRTRGKLYPYIGETGEALACPAAPFGGPYKPKFEGPPWTYGINRYLSSHQTPAGGKTNGAGNANIASIRPQDAGRTVLFADAAEVNTFQAPASPKNPMVEDWYYLEPGRRYVQFRHDGLANVLFADWHVDAVGPAAGSLDPRLPRAMIGYFSDEDVLFEPRAGK